LGRGLAECKITKIDQFICFDLGQNSLALGRATRAISAASEMALSENSPTGYQATISRSGNELLVEDIRAHSALVILSKCYKN
jgi:hypothetical protein